MIWKEEAWDVEAGLHELESHMPPPRSLLPLSAQWGPEMGTEVPSSQSSNSCCEKPVPS